MIKNTARRMGLHVITCDGCSSIDIIDTKTNNSMTVEVKNAHIKEGTVKLTAD
jgi:hypothetical protein